MKLVETVTGLHSALDACGQGKKVGLVPTMGALHAGHASLVRRCVADNDVTVVSVFVNPTQFNDKNDLKNYPRTFDADCKLLEEVGADIVFAPSVEEIYPQADTRVFDFAPLDTVMEGVHRPGHFNGVAQVVSRLFDIVKPDRAYFGEKDFQQLAIIRRLVSDYGYHIEIVPCPIVREADGLAMSSRNTLLTAEGRQHAPAIHRIMQDSVAFASAHTVDETRRFVEDGLAADGYLRAEYYEIVDGRTLQPIADWQETDYAVGCVAVFCGDIRLIDNIKYKG